MQVIQSPSNSAGDRAWSSSCSQRLMASTFWSSVRDGPGCDHDALMDLRRALPSFGLVVFTFGLQLHQRGVRVRRARQP